jgi:DNA repair protein RadC
MSGARGRIGRASDALREVVSFLEPRADAEVLTSGLLRRFGSPGAVVEAGKQRLSDGGLSDSGALMVSMIPDIVRHVERQRFGPHPCVGTLLEAERYLAMRYLGLSIERFYMLPLDRSGRLIELVELQSGSEESAPFYLKHVLSETVRTGAAAIVISHNHPNATPRPSRADIDCTAALMDALDPIGAPLIDHIIMVGRRAVSVRGYGFVPARAWEAREGENPLVARWLDGWTPDGLGGARDER